MTQEHKAYYQSEIGWLEIIGTEDAIKAVEFIEPEEIEENNTKPPCCCSRLCDSTGRIF